MVEVPRLVSGGVSGDLASLLHFGWCEGSGRFTGCGRDTEDLAQLDGRRLYLDKRSVFEGLYPVAYCAWMTTDIARPEYEGLVVDYGFESATDDIDQGLMSVCVNG